MKALLWYQRFAEQQVEMYDCLEDAIEAAIEIDEAGTGALQYIEHDGQQFTRASDEYKAVVKRREREESEDLAQRMAETRWRLLLEGQRRWHILESTRSEVSAKASLAAAQRDFPNRNFRLVKVSPQ